MANLTEKQINKFYNVVMDSLQNGNVNDFYCNGDQRLCAKLEKDGIIVVVATDERDCFRFYNEVNGIPANTDCQAILSEFGLSLATELFGDVYAQKKERNFSRNVCPKCDGKGYIREYGHIAGGVCFNCNGTGRNK